jgi:hypothetical protein
MIDNSKELGNFDAFKAALDSRKFLGTKEGIVGSLSNHSKRSFQKFISSTDIYS